MRALCVDASCEHMHDRKQGSSSSTTMALACSPASSICFSGASRISQEHMQEHAQAHMHKMSECKHKMSECTHKMSAQHFSALQLPLALSTLFVVFEASKKEAMTTRKEKQQVT